MTINAYTVGLEKNVIRVKSASGPENLSITFRRTVRVPDNHDTSELPPDLGKFPLFQINDYKDGLPPSMVNKGGIFMPMFPKYHTANLIKHGVAFTEISSEREAMWIKFKANSPFAIKIYVGGINVVSGENIFESESTRELPQKQAEECRSVQDYVVIPKQKWLDGIAAANGIVKQFVAMPFGDGYSVEAQMTEEEHVAGIQFEVTPANDRTYRNRQSKNITVKTLTGKMLRYQVAPGITVSTLKHLIQQGEGLPPDQQRLIYKAKLLEDEYYLEDYGISDGDMLHLVLRLRGGGHGVIKKEMGIAAGGNIKQVVVPDHFKSTMWNGNATITFNVQILNALSFANATGLPAPTTPISAETYHELGLPFFEMYTEPTEIKGDFGQVKSVGQMLNEETEPSYKFPLKSVYGTTTGECSDDMMVDLTNPAGPLRSFRHVSELENDLKQMKIYP